MIKAVAVLTGLLAAAAVAGGTAVASAGVLDGHAAQTLAVDIGPSGTRVQRLPSYVSTSPVAVRIVAPRASAIVLDGVAPDRTATSVALARDASGAFTGNAVVDQPGTWSFAVETTADGTTTTSPTFSLNVRPGPSLLDIGLIVALALASFGGGVGLITVGRKTAHAADTAVPVSEPTQTGKLAA